MSSINCTKVQLSPNSNHEIDFEDKVSRKSRNKIQLPKLKISCALDDNTNSTSTTYSSTDELDPKDLSEDDEPGKLAQISSQLRRSYSTLDPTSIPKYLKRNESFSTVIINKNERRVLVLYTGGTIGMVRCPKTGALVPISNCLEKTIRTFPHLHDDKYSQRRFGVSDEIGGLPLVVPEQYGENYRIVYTIYEYDPILDSSNMTMDDWIHIAIDIKENYEAFDGFVVLHGTDTMAYTSSALSFMMENLGKTVVITGSQIPLFEARSDGRDNFLGALILAGSYVIPEVTLFFNHKLFRGNRTTKISSDSLNAFDSPNMPPLATMGINIQVDYSSIFRPKIIAPFRVHANMNRNVGLLRLFPSITTETVKSFLREPTIGVVLQSYGSGNFPTNRLDLLEELSNASKRGIIIVNCSQCGQGGVSAIYETGHMLQAKGIIPGYDMTPEAALTKLSYLLARDDLDLDKKRELFQMSIRGELTRFQPSYTAAGGVHHTRRGLSPDYTGDEQLGQDMLQKIVRIITRSLDLQSAEEIEAIKQLIIPSLTCALVVHSSQRNFNLQNLESLFGKSEAEISQSDYSGKTPLHLASALGDLTTIEFLLEKGASVHVRDNRGFSPLREAIEFDHHEVIKILRNCGSHLTLEPPALGSELCLAASKGDVTRLESFRLTGSNLNEKDLCGRTPLISAIEAGKIETVEWLVRKGVSTSTPNSLGKSPLEIALLLKNNSIIDILMPKCHKK